MFYLMLATLCSASIALIFKYSERHDTNRYVVTSANYFIAFSTSFFMLLRKGLLKEGVMITGFVDVFNGLGGEDIYVLPPSASATWALLVGSIAGVFFFLSFIFYQISIRDNGAGLSGTFAKLGILVPMIFSILFWRELPTSIQWIGIVLSLAAIIIVNLSKDTLSKFNFKPTLLLLFSFGGLAEFSNKIFQKYAINDYKDLFLFSVFFVAFMISILYVALRKSKIRFTDILIGFAVGIPNLFSSYFLILALDIITTSVVFSIYSAGSIVLITLGSFLAFGEKVATKNKFAIALIVVALVLINL